MKYYVTPAYTWDGTHTCWIWKKHDEDKASILQAHGWSAEHNLGDMVSSIPYNIYLGDMVSSRPCYNILELLEVVAKINKTEMETFCRHL